MFLKLPFYNPQIKIKDLIGSFFLKEPKEKLLSYLQNYFSSENILLLKSARQGIKFILESLNLNKDDEVILPSFICSVVPEAVIRAGAKPIFCDVEKNGFNLDIEKAKKLISSKTRAIILAYIFGIPSSIDKFVELAETNKIILIEDCAQAFGAKYKGKLLGTFGDFSVFSFGISKNIAGLGGGFLLSQDKENLQKIKEISSRIKGSNFSLKKYLEFFFIPLVFNKYLYWLFSDSVEKYAKTRRDEGGEKEFSLSPSSLEAKIAFLKLKRYEKNQKMRNENALLYQEELKDFFSFPLILAEGSPAYPYLSVLASQEIFNILKTQNIPVRRLDLGNEEKCFLLPLNYSSPEIKSIIQQIKKILIISKSHDK